MISGPVIQICQVVFQSPHELAKFSSPCEGAILFTIPDCVFSVEFNTPNDFGQLYFHTDTPGCKRFLTSVFFQKMAYTKKSQPWMFAVPLVYENLKKRCLETAIFWLLAHFVFTQEFKTGSVALF